MCAGYERWSGIVSLCHKPRKHPPLSEHNHQWFWAFSISFTQLRTLIFTALCARSQVYAFSTVHVEARHEPPDRASSRGECSIPRSRSFVEGWQLCGVYCRSVQTHQHSMLGSKVAAGAGCEGGKGESSTCPPWGCCCCCCCSCCCCRGDWGEGGGREGAAARASGRPDSRTCDPHEVKRADVLISPTTGPAAVCPAAAGCAQQATCWSCLLLLLLAVCVPVQQGGQRPAKSAGRWGKVQRVG